MVFNRGICILNNFAIYGYALLAGKKLGLSHRALQQLECVMRSVLDEHTEKEATEAYRKN